MADLTSAPADHAAWEYPSGEGRAVTAGPAASPLLSVAGFEGPLDFLLEMVRRQRIDLGQLAILPLIDQFVAAFAAARDQVPPERRGDWLVMASTLLQLKAELLWPATPAAAEHATAAAARRLDALDELARMRAAAAWLAARPQLGIDAFALGRTEATPSRQAELVVAFLEATLVMLEGRDGTGAAAPPLYQPPVSDLWQMPDAIRRVRQLLADCGDWRLLGTFLPEIPLDATHRELRCRAAVASTLMAGLELARDGTLAAQQSTTFGSIHFRGSAVSGEAARAHPA